MTRNATVSFIIAPTEEWCGSGEPMPYPNLGVVRGAKFVATLKAIPITPTTRSIRHFHEKYRSGMSIRDRSDASDQSFSQEKNMIKLYGNPYSRANRVRWALEASGAKYEEETLSLGPEGTGSKRFRSINPNGLVPAINDDGLILFESVPICLYIAKKYAPTSLYVESIRDEGLLLQWSVWAMTELEKHNETASLHVTWFSAPKRDASIAASEQAEVSRCLSMLEEAIKESGFLVANRFTIADLIVSEVLTALVHAKIDLNDFPRVKHYLKMNLSQPSAQKAFASDVIQPYLT